MTNAAELGATCCIAMGFQHLFQCRGQLIRAAGGFVPATDALQFRYYLLHFHPFNQSADTLQIAIASANKTHIVKSVFFIHFKKNLLTASPLRTVFILFHNFNHRLKIIHSAPITVSSSLSPPCRRIGNEHRKLIWSRTWSELP